MNLKMLYGVTMNYTNNKNIGLSLAVFLAHDEYDYDPRPNAISATTLQKSTRQIILSKRVVANDMSIDISSLVASSFGTAIHDAVEKAWLSDRYVTSLARLGYSKDTIARIKINPKPDELTENTIAIYIEQRSEKTLGNWIIVGKYDFVGDGQLEDHKSTGVYTYIKKDYIDKFKRQGSIYRWLNPKVITRDQMIINFVFTDWSKLKSAIEKEKGYPAERLVHVPIPLMSLSETQRYIEDKLKAIEANISTPEPDLPLCSKEELWQDDTVYAYYRNPDATGNSTKNFNNFSEAQMRLNKDGGTGVIKIRKGLVKFCAWCPAAAICSQCKQLIDDGLFNPEGA